MSAIGPREPHLHCAALGCSLVEVALGMGALILGIVLYLAGAGWAVFVWLAFVALLAFVAGVAIFLDWLTGGRHWLLRPLYKLGLL